MGTLSQRIAPASASTQDQSPAPQLNPNASRRRFLWAFGAGGAGVAVVATQALAAPVLPAATPPLNAAGEGYRETEHIRDYYATTRL